MSSNKTDIWLPWYPADYLKDTLELTLEEDAFYRRALDQVWMRKGSIPSDPEKLKKILRISSKNLKSCGWILERFFYRSGEDFRNIRSDLELGAANAKAAIARNNGRNGGRPRNPEKTQRVISGLPNHNPDHNPDHNPEKSSSPSPSDPPNSPPGEFRKNFPVLCQAFGIKTPSIRDEGEMYEAWLELQAKKSTTADLEKRIGRYREMFPGYPATRNAIFKNWHVLTPPLPKPKRIEYAEDIYIPDSLRENA